LLDLKEVHPRDILMVSLHVCYAFHAMVDRYASIDYSLKPEPLYMGGVCHVAIANVGLHTENYGGLALYDDGSMHFDVPRKIRDPGHAEKLVKELEGCGCQEAWVHPHILTPELQILAERAHPDLEILARRADRGKDSFHYHCNAPPSLSARQCAVKKVLEEP